MLHSFFSLATKPFALPRFARVVALLAGLAIVLPGCSDDDDTPADPQGPNKITVPRAALHPEGIQYDDANKRFFVSSRTEGRIGIVKDDSTYTQFADDAQLISTIGLNLDASRNRLLVAISDNNTNPARTNPATQRRLAALAIYNTTNGTRTSYVDLGSLRPMQNHFANDIAVDSQGNAYITDSLSPIIYIVTPQGLASVFLENAQLSGGTGFGLNGIVFHPDGYLLVAKANDGALFKVPISNPNSFSRVTTSQNLTGADGLLLTDNQTLLVVSGSQSTVFRMSSSDGWANTSNSGSFATGAVSPTTITRRGNDAYVLYPYQPTSPRFAITKVKF
ncbi:SMP-30/gluconolactonase/LRE family protein [Hymenobacter norwichensis]|uniref:SMP-30/gluconolactonase/LRE family protein n=1 Tax=Hymenobacter norwichensis TaxID=223903 RepID=UPI0003B360D0|nr:SMP-30/gluconolactonase/LRE family protein [Hymenobacter norwichensis]